MGLSQEELIERKNDERVKDITSKICNKDGDKPYVFISYKSDDWKIVLKDIVYRLVNDYGLNVYFDGDFDTHNSLWIEQFPQNMNSPLCRGVLAFLDDKYATSYATLLELMYSQAGCQDEDNEYEFYHQKVVPVNLDKLTSIKDKSDTGLGKSVYEDDTKNIHAEDELTLFNDTFDTACDTFNIFKKAKKPYNNNRKNTGIFLPKDLCSVMVGELLLSIKANDNYYNGNLDGIVESIKDACGSEVFSKKQSIHNNDNKNENENKDERNNKDDSDLIDRTRTGTESEPPMPLKNLWTYRAKGVFSTIEWNGTSKNCVVLKGSRAAAEAAGFVKLSSAKNLKDELIENGTLVNDEFVRDYSCNKISTMINVLNGGSVSMPDAIKKGVLAPKGKNPIIVTPPLQAVNQTGFEYLLWGEAHSADKLVTLMHQVFDLIAQKYPQKIELMADNDSITAVARKKDVDEGILSVSKLNYFQAKKEHTVGEQSYYMSTRYNREQGIGQLKKMLTFCEGNADALQFTKMPDKAVHAESD